MQICATRVFITIMRFIFRWAMFWSVCFDCLKDKFKLQIDCGFYRQYWIWRHRSNICPTRWRLWVCACLCAYLCRGCRECCVLLWCAHLDAQTVWLIADKGLFNTVNTRITRVLRMFVELISSFMTATTHNCCIKQTQICQLEKNPQTSINYTNSQFRENPK